MAEQQSSSSADGSSTKLKALEAKAVAEATATADAAFSPSPSLLNASSPIPLLTQVDGPSLKDYESKDSVYVAKSVPVAPGSNISVPIQVTTPGSVVEYAVENKYYDIEFGVTAEREEGITIVKETERVDATESALTGKFLVGSVPCLIQFQFGNQYSWMREKVISYRITVTPPSRETLQAGRRRRAKACHKAVQEDLSSAQKRLTGALEQKTQLEAKVQALQKELEQAKQSLEVIAKEEAWLQNRVKLRKDQTKLLEQRLNDGWDDEHADH